MNHRHVKTLTMALTAGLVLLAGCSSTSDVEKKASSLLRTQVELRREQIAEPTVARLQLMQRMGMNVDNLSAQRIFIHMYAPPDAAQTAEMQAMGIVLFPDSWLPPAGVNKTGFLLADMPVDKFETLAAKDYVIKLDTAERQLAPQPNTPQ